MTDTIETRLRRLERHARRWRAAAVVLALVLAATFSLGQGEAEKAAAPKGDPADLTARSLLLVDAEGNPRAVFRVSDAGDAELALADAAGTRRAALVAAAEGEGGAGLTLFRANGDTAINAFLGARGEPSIRLIGTRGPRGVPQLGMSVFAGPQLDLHAGPKGARLIAGALAEESHVLLTHGASKARAVLAVRPEGARATLRDEAGEERFSAPR